VLLPSRRGTNVYTIWERGLSGQNTVFPALKNDQISPASSITFFDQMEEIIVHKLAAIRKS
jgi:hypothetical protein